MATANSPPAESLPAQESRASDGATNLSEKLSTLSVSTSAKEEQIPSSQDAGPTAVELEKRIRALKKKVNLFLDHQLHWLVFFFLETALLHCLAYVPNHVFGIPSQGKPPYFCHVTICAIL